MDDRTAYQFIAISPQDRLHHPPTLLKLSLSDSHALTQASQSFSQSFTQAKQDTSKLVCSATRLLNGQQQSVELQLDQDDLLESAKKRSKNKHLELEEARNMLFDAFKKRETCKAEYDGQSRKLEVSLDSLPGFGMNMDFDRAQKVHITPAFAIAFEAAMDFHKQNVEHIKTAQTSADSLRLKEQDLRLSDRKLSNLQIELAEANTKLRRLLDSGGSSLADLGSNGMMGTRDRQRLRMGESSAGAGDGSGRDDSESPRKKRKAAIPTLGKAGRVAVKKVASGFVDSSSEGSDKGEPSKASKTSDMDRARAERQSATSTSREASVDPETEKQSKGKAPAKKVMAANPNPPKLGRTGQKPVETGFVDDDEDSQDKADSATEESDASGSGKRKNKKK